MLANIEALFDFIKENKSLLVSRLLMTISHYIFLRTQSGGIQFIHSGVIVVRL